MNFKTIDKKYRPIPFWSWNDKLNTDETVRQIGIMDSIGIGGYFMHARGGLLTPYMGEEWFDNVAVSVEEGKKRGMQPWAYDENGWPSGFGNGIVNGHGLDFQQKYLRYEAGDKTNARTIISKDGYHFYYDVNPYYVDTLDKKVTECFINEIYEPYYQKFGKDICGFFTDEPQISRKGIPWSFILPSSYKKEYGEELLDHLIELFRPVGDYENTRLKFWKLITKLFSENFMKPIYEWCVSHDLGLTGHLLLEETLLSQLTTNGACMPHYEYFTMPGMDWLGRDIFDCLTPLQVSSVAHQLGKKEILSETFALCGHGAGFDDFKRIFQWQTVNGITKMCPHLEGYSLKGLRKRDYPPAMYYQQPWWEEYRYFIDAMSRIGMLMSEGEVHFDTLLLHNQSSAWICFDGEDSSGIEKYNDALLNDIKVLTRKHILFHLGDEIIMERHAHVEEGTLVIGTQRYTKIVVPEHKAFLPNTLRLLGEFEAAGGFVTTSDKIEDSDICDCPLLTYTSRDFENYKVDYYINNTEETLSVNFKHGSKMLDITSGDILPFYGSYTFRPFESLVLIDDGLAFPKLGFKKQLRPLNLSGHWQIKENTLNCLTIDVCDVYFDDEKVGSDENVPDVLYMALEKRRSVNVRCEYKFIVNEVPETAFLVCELPRLFKIIINGKPLETNDVGYFIDNAFRKLPLNGYLAEGENVVSLEATINPSSETYNTLEKAAEFESEKNKLTFDIEFEAIYIVGNFSVKTDGEFEQLQRNAVRYHGGFAIDKPAEKLNLSGIERQGFPFFSGRITLTKTFDLPDENYGIFFSKKGVNSVLIKVNDTNVGCTLWEPYIKDLSNALHKGTNTIEITLVNNLRNMLGPHHLPLGESYSVCPKDFYKRGNIWTDFKDNSWDNAYSFIEFGIEQQNAD